jgi:glycosyltransferase involved in cell wall biosynthesis
MKVLYDISVLGKGHRSPKARTGIFRVIENLANELVKIEGLDLAYVSEFTPDTITASVEYLASNSNLSVEKFRMPKLFRQRMIAQKKWTDLLSDIENKNQSHLRRFPAQIQMRYQATVAKISEKYFSHRYFTSHVYKGQQIFHSTFLPVSQKSREQVKAVFLTSYDLIPILYPEYVEKVLIDLIKNVLGSITPDTWVLCISEATRNDLLNYLGPKADPDKVIVTELAASDNFYQSRDKELNKAVRDKYGIPDAPYILSLCTLEPRKNIDQAIRAFVQMCRQERIHDLHMVLVGTKGWMFDKIFNELDASADIRDRIIITGFVHDSDLAAIYSDAAMFVYPSFYEGFGLPPLEAMKCGVPVISSNTSSLPEVVGDAGIMVAPTDLTALTQAMLSVYNDNALQQQMRAKSLERAAKFSWERCAHETVTAYKRSIGG